jgi:hypothetical protein
MYEAITEDGISGASFIWTDGQEIYNDLKSNWGVASLRFLIKLYFVALSCFCSIRYGYYHLFCWPADHDTINFMVHNVFKILIHALNWTSMKINLQMQMELA